MDVEKMKVTELKAALAERGLDTKGNKAALVERLQAVVEEEGEGGEQEEQSNGGGGDTELYDPQEEASSSSEPDADPGHNGEHTNGAENTENHEDEDEQSGPGFGHQEFVHSKPQGISFGLHEPTKVKPQPKEAPVPAADPDPDTDSADARGRAAAASFFAAHSGGEAAVPLPPSTSFMEDSEDEEEEGPPGLGSVELPPEIFKKVKNTGNRDMKEH